MRYSTDLFKLKRIQWINDRKLTALFQSIPRLCLRGRKGYGSAYLIRYLFVKQLLDLRFRDLESLTGIHHTTFIKFRKRLLQKGVFERLFAVLSRCVHSSRYLTLIMDSTFVETFSKKQESGSKYNGYKKKNGFKCHQVIDEKTRLPVTQSVTSGSASDIREAGRLFSKRLRFRAEAFLADKGYDGESFVLKLKERFGNIPIGIPVRHTGGNAYNLSMKRRERCLLKPFYQKRSTVERFFSRRKGVFHLGKDQYRGIANFRFQCFLIGVMEFLEWMVKQPAKAW